MARLEPFAWGAHQVFVSDEGSGAPVVMLHSSGMSGRQWRRLAEAVVARGMRAVVPDLLGNGRSSTWPASEPFTFERDVELVLGMLDRIGEPVALVAHSYGGLVALHAARARPQSIRSLALYDPVAFGVLDGRDRDARANIDGVDFSWVNPELWLQGFVEYWNGSGSWAQLGDATRAEMRRVGWVVHEGARTLVADRTPASAYAELAAPALLLTGQHSTLAARRVVERLGEVLAATMVVIADAGHMGPLTHMSRVNAAILAHLDQVSAPGRTA